ncbi:hypothetical protein [Mycolicibacterium mageritense]|uniref:hypothetical protein n=1 Tax=Mycolicibacterium mageritense TaxID=53462 RepID=UPI001E5125C6|nr:hypothetical protein [Mycolicibacterium mageritense]MCC9183913.1 hypothetical protein [Mycolicibacterium mageritense]
MHDPRERATRGHQRGNPDRGQVRTGDPVPAAQASTNMYAPGGPMASAWHTSTAITAMTDTVTMPSHGVAAAQSPSATATAKHAATTPR